MEAVKGTLKKKAEGNGRRNYLVTYDITRPKFLKKVFKICSGYGRNLQYSVFWCALTIEDVQILADKLKPLLCAEDQILFFRLQEVRTGKLQKGWVQVLGKKIAAEPDKFWIIT
ncbi:MAG: CRISPR-associated endonuclease Cas2 [Turneriella sp.]|nr:CRISPR-associated endonuclease Cas2 [Turneriella sp.]